MTPKRLGAAVAGVVAAVAVALLLPQFLAPENQCEAYGSGEADHFVELDPERRYIRSGGRRFFGLFRAILILL